MNRPFYQYPLDGHPMLNGFIWGLVSVILPTLIILWAAL